MLKPFKTYTGTRVLLYAHYLTALNESENRQIILKMKEWPFLEIFAKNFNYRAYCVELNWSG